MIFSHYIGKLDEKLAKIYAAEIVLVLETIHTNNVMHRDLKPENIMLNDDLHLKVVCLTLDKSLFFLTKSYLDRLW
jgi:serine/threonine protein kinase